MNHEQQKLSVENLLAENQTILQNIKCSIRRKELVSIGGGVFNHQEMSKLYDLISEVSIYLELENAKGI
jgi:hypothetical protein